MLSRFACWLSNTARNQAAPVSQSTQPFQNQDARILQRKTRFHVQGTLNILRVVSVEKPTMTGRIALLKTHVKSVEKLDILPKLAALTRAMLHVLRPRSQRQMRNSASLWMTSHIKSLYHFLTPRPLTWSKLTQIIPDPWRDLILISLILRIPTGPRQKIREIHHICWISLLLCSRLLKKTGERLFTVWIIPDPWRDLILIPLILQIPTCPRQKIQEINHTCWISLRLCSMAKNIVSHMHPRWRMRSKTKVSQLDFYLPRRHPLRNIWRPDWNRCTLGLSYRLVMDMAHLHATFNVLKLFL